MSDADALRLFRELLDLDPAERSRALDAACAGDDELRERVVRLLEADKTGPDLAWIVEREIGRELDGASEGPPGEEIDLTGRRIGRYRIVRRIGSGGMGTVYEAEQDEPRRRVALKTLRFGVDSKEAVSRFKLEAQVLARMSHPGIATILEAGRSEGVPFFAMEFVEGARPLTEYAEAEGRSDAARVDLFLEFCDAVAYGHARGVVHRDLKPQNLLVDREGRPKIIDFGVARALDPVPDVTLQPTSSGEIVGTLGAMSPEQLSGDPEEVDVQSDVYALGVVLFQLLTGERPKEARGLSLTEAIRVLSTSEPRRLGDARPDLPVELEWIVGKALETDRARRYRSANDLADDLRRFRAHEPVVASPPSTVYRVRKFVRRHRVGVAAGALVLLSLVGGMIATGLALVRESAQRRRLERMTEFQTSIFSSMQAQGLGPDARMADALDLASSRVAAEFDEDPVSRAELERSFGIAYFALGRFEDARRMYEGAVDVLVAEFGPRSEEALASRIALASTLDALDEIDAAIAMYEPLVEDCREAIGGSAPPTIRSELFLARALLRRGEVERANGLLARAADGLERGLARGFAYGNVPMMLADTRGRALAEAGDVEGAAAVYRAAEASIAARFGDDLPDLANIRFNHGMLLKSARRYGEARPLLRDALRVMRPHLGAEHPMVEIITVHLAESIRQAEDGLEEAIPLYTEAIRLKRARGDRPFAIQQMEANRISILWSLGRFEEVDRRQRALVEEVDRESPDHWFRWFVHLQRGRFLVQRGRLEEAAPALEWARDLGERFAGEGRVRPAETAEAWRELEAARRGERPAEEEEIPPTSKGR